MDRSAEPDFQPNYGSLRGDGPECCAVNICKGVRPANERPTGAATGGGADLLGAAIVYACAKMVRLQCVEVVAALVCISSGGDLP